MRAWKTLEIAVLSSFALAGTACTVSIDQTLEMQEGSGVDISIVSEDGSFEIPQGRLAFEGGTVMRINVSTSLLDYLDGTMDGDVEVLDLLFGVPSFTFLVAETGLVCVVLDETADNGGTFEYDTLAQEAHFDVFVGTRAIPVEGNFAQLLRGGAFAFPFDLEATIPLTLVDAVGLVSGTGSLVVSQDIDAFFEARIKGGQDPANDTIIPMHVQGTVTLESVDAFPATPLVLDCLDALAGA